MKWIISTLVLLFAVSLMAQQPSVSPSSPPMMTNADVQHNIQTKISSDAHFVEPFLTVTVTDDSVILSGRLDDVQENERALSIARSYAEGRRIEDDVQIQPLCRCPL